MVAAVAGPLSKVVNLIANGAMGSYFAENGTAFYLPTRDTFI